MKALATLALLAFAALSLASLLSGTSYLEFALPGGLPAGNALAAIGLCALAAVPLLLSHGGSALRKAAAATFAAAVAWLPLSIALAGNLALNFSNGRGSIWIGFSVAVVVAVLSLLAWALAVRLAALCRRVASRICRAGRP